MDEGDKKADEILSFVLLGWLPAVILSLFEVYLASEEDSHNLHQTKTIKNTI